MRLLCVLVCIASVRAGLIIHSGSELGHPGATAYSHSFSSIETGGLVPQDYSVPQPQVQYVQVPQNTGLEQTGLNTGLRGVEYVSNSDNPPSTFGDRKGRGKYWVSDSDGSSRSVEYSAADLNGVLQPQVPSVTLVSEKSLYNGQTNGITEAFYDKKTPLAHALNEVNGPNLVYQI